MTVADKNDVTVVDAALSVLSFDDDSELSSSMKGTDSDSSLDPLVVWKDNAIMTLNAVVVVKWSALLPTAPMIRVWIPLAIKYLQKDENKQKEAKVGLLKNEMTWCGPDTIFEQLTHNKVKL